jgi:hypothetical protein
MKVDLGRGRSHRSVIERGDVRRDRDGRRSRAELAADPCQPVLIERSDHATWIGHLKAAEDRIGLNVHGLGSVHAHRGSSAEVERVTESQHSIRADRSGRTDAGHREVSVRNRGGEVAARKDL